MKREKLLKFVQTQCLLSAISTLRNSRSSSLNLLASNDGLRDESAAAFGLSFSGCIFHSSEYKQDVAKSRTLQHWWSEAK